MVIYQQIKHFGVLDFLSPQNAIISINIKDFQNKEFFLNATKLYSFPSFTHAQLKIETTKTLEKVYLNLLKMLTEFSSNLI